MRASTFRYWLLAAAVLLAACQQESTPTEAPAVAATPAPACALTVGWDPWEPYQFEAADGRVTGLDIEVLRLLADDAGCTVDFTRGEWRTLLDQLKAGKIDVLLAATVLPEREEFARFSPPYRDETFGLFVRKADLEAMRDQDLPALLAAGRKIGVTEGYYYGKEVTDLRYGDSAAQFVAAPIVEVNYARLVNGEIDALLDDPVVAASVLRRKGWDTAVVEHPVRIRTGDVALMFSKASVDEATVQRFNDALKQRRDDGTLEQLIGRYQPGN